MTRATRQSCLIMDTPFVDTLLVLAGKSFMCLLGAKQRMQSPIGLPHLFGVSATVPQGRKHRVTTLENPVNPCRSLEEIPLMALFELSRRTLRL